MGRESNESATATVSPIVEGAGERTAADKDAALLATLGYKQEFKRNFSPLEVFGVVFSIIALVPSVASVLVFALPYGGAAAMVWGWTVCSIFLIIIGLAMAELGSAAPTSGGLYYWTFMFSSDKWRRFLSWMVAYSNTVANIAGVASVDWGCAVQIMAGVSIGSNQTFSPTNAQTYGVFCAILISHGIICSLNTSIIARLQKLFIVINVLLCVAVIVALPAATPPEFKNNAKYAFGNFTNLSGWPDGYAFILSFLYPLWTIGAFDSPIHISEEVTNANVAIPWAIILGASISAVIGWGINVALTFCMGTDLEAIVNSPIDQPVATILFNSLGQKGTLAIWSFIVVVQFALGTNLATACSRQVFAFSRDGGLPLSRVLYYISPRTHSPVTSVWFVVICAILLGLLSFAGPTAISAIFSIVVAGQYVAYSVPIAARFLGGKNIRPGPFSLGFMSLPVAVVAVTFMIFIVIVFMFPNSPHPAPQDMNYTVVVLGGTLTLAAAYYYFPKYGGVYWFEGPIRNIPIVPDSDDGVISVVHEKGSSEDKK